MPATPRLYIDNGCFHIISRGNQKQQLFNKPIDYLKYLLLLKKYKKKYLFKVYGYCLMPNHVHIVGQIEKATNLSKLIQVVHKIYTTYFNNTYDKVGHLWQGRFKNKLMVKDLYFINCINYIECNPARAKIVSSPEEYIWSSYKERNMLDCQFKLLDPLSL